MPAIGVAGALMLGPVTLPPVVLSATAAPAAPQESQPVKVADLAAAILENPLFAPDRRRPPPARTAVTTLAALPRLSGTLLTPQGRAAILTPPDGKPVTVVEGAMLGEDRVIEIDTAAVTISGPHGVHALRLAFAGIEAPMLRRRLRFVLQLGDR